MAAITIIVAYSEYLPREILQNIFELKPGFVVIGVPATSASLQKMAAALQPDVIIVDIALDGMKGLKAIQKVMASCPKTKVIISWCYTDERLMAAALAAGCAGYMIEDISPYLYFVAVQDVMNGNIYYCNQTIRLKSPPQLPNKNFAMLSFCMRRGYTSEETAMAAGLTKKTVDTYRKRFKLHVGSLSTAAMLSFIDKQQ
jgi:DNA-binding NarL/FixJ family response regulator